MRRIIGLALALTCSTGLASNGLASDLARAARFAGLHGAAEHAVDAATLAGGLTITGEKLQLEDGNFTAAVAQVASPYFVMTGVGARGRMPLDAAFFADVITAAVGNILDGSTITMATFKNAQKPDDSIANVTLKDLKLVHTHGQLEGELYAVVAHAQFKAHSSYDKATRRLTVSVDSVKAAGLPVPLSVAFFTMGQFMKYPFVHLDNPRVVIDLKPFLPPPGQ